MKWIDILKAKTRARGGGSKPKREKVLSKPEQGRMDQLGEDIRAYKQSLKEEEDEMYIGDYAESSWDYDGEGDWITEEDAERWMAKPRLPPSLGDVTDIAEFPGQQKIHNLMTKEVENIYRDFREFLKNNGFSTAIERANQLDRDDYVEISLSSKFGDSEIGDVVSSMRKHFYEWDDVVTRLDWNKKTEQGQNANIPALWAVKRIQYDVQYATGKRYEQHYGRDRRDGRTNVYSEPLVNKPKKVRLNKYELQEIQFLRDNVSDEAADKKEKRLLDFYNSRLRNQPKAKSEVYLMLYIKGIVTDALDYEFYTLKYSTAFEKDAVLQEEMDLRINPERDIKRGLHRDMFNASKTDVLEFQGDEETSKIINKLRRFFGYYIRA